MKIELHAIQSFAPANLNRDADGAPKECTFGGVRRARVSSQSWKRAIRLCFRNADLGEVGVRTKRAHEAIVERMRRLAPELDADTAAHRAAVLLEAAPLGLSLKRNKPEHPIKTGQLIFFRERDLDTLAGLAVEYGGELDGLESSVSGGKKPDKLSKDLAKAISTTMTTPGHALDIALFGRMVAELPEANIDAACQVAHAIGTHRLKAADDFYTAVDDLKPEDTEGADMIGTIYFNASCFYRYAVVDVAQLADNLGAAAESDHVRIALDRFVRAFVTAIPGGKQASFAAHNPPSAVLAVRRQQGAMNLANAFVEPVTDPGLVTSSITQLLGEFTKLERLYGDGETTHMLLTGETVDHDGPRAEHLDDLVGYVASDV